MGDRDTHGGWYSQLEVDEKMVDEGESPALAEELINQSLVKGRQL